MFERSLEGHLPSDDALSIRSALSRVPAWTRRLVDYRPRDPWEEDAALLPRPLRAHRREMRRFAEVHLRPRALRVDVEPHRAPGDAGVDGDDVLRAAGRAGLLSDLLPRPIGSANPALFGHPLALAQAIKTEELAAVDGGLMLLICAHALGAAPILLSGEARAIRRWLVPAFRACERGEPELFAFAITEPGGGSDVEEGHGATRYVPGVVARPVDGGYRLRGRKVFISGGDLAKVVVVFAALEGEGMASWTAFVVPRGAAGFRAVRTERKMGMRASSAAELELDDVFVPASAIVGGLRSGWSLNRATLTMSRLPVAAMGVGFARAAIDEAVAFARSFRLGRKRLLDYQDVQLAIADMLAETQAARAMVWSAASRWQALQRESSAAKFHATDVARRVCTAAMDLLQDHAVLHSRRVEKAYRDARLTQIFEGTNEINRLAVIEDLQDRLLGAGDGAAR